MKYDRINFNPEIGMHCWGFVRYIYRDRTNTELIQFPYTNPKQNGQLIDNVVSTLPECTPSDLAIFVADSENGDRMVGIIIDIENELYGCFMTTERSRVLPWALCDRAFKPKCYRVEPLIRDASDRASFQSMADQNQL